MSSKGGLISRLACLMCISYLIKLKDRENHEFSLKLHISPIADISVVFLCVCKFLMCCMLQIFKH